MKTNRSPGSSARWIDNLHSTIRMIAEGYDEKNRSHERWEVRLLNPMQKKMYSSS